VRPARDPAAGRLSCFAHLVRLRLLAPVLDRPRSVKELAAALGLPPPHLHLNLLREAGVLVPGRVGRAVVDRPHPDHFAPHPGRRYVRPRRRVATDDRATGRGEGR
jgi:hypothetical protein